VNNSGSTRGALRGSVFDLDLVDERPGLVVIHVHGVGAAALFADEAGGHRFQRVPPNDKRDRVQTSTITVAVLSAPSDTELRLDPQDLEWRWSRGSGPGGQHRNKTESAVDLTHRPTGVTVHCESERSRLQNQAIALATLRARIAEANASRAERERSDTRRAQVGSGMRGDKRRTIRYQDGTVVDHDTGRRWSLREYLRGEW
jgi:peptide chain release factor 1